VTLSIIVPWRSDHGHRERVWNYLRPQWEALGHELIVQDDPEPGTWSTARALRAAVPKTTGDVIVAYGADHLPDPDVLDTAVKLMDTHAWCYTYADVAYATEASTAALLAGDITEDQLTWGHYSGRCVGMWAWRRSTWDETGGVDPRFVGWGYGDDAWNDVLETVYGPSSARPGNVLRELWHPDGERDASQANPNHGLYYTEYAPYRGNREYMLAMKEQWT
jgi:hypothetical protein